MTVIGNAEILVHANTAGFAAEVEASTAPAFAAVQKEAAVAGERSGAALATGMKTGSTEAGAAASGLGAVVRKATMGIAAAIVGTAAVGVHMAEGLQTSEAAIASATHVSVAGAREIGDAFLGTAGKLEVSGPKMAEAYAKVAAQLKITQGRSLDAKEATEFMSATAELAAGKQIDLGQATNTTAGIMQAFGLDVKDTAHVTDVLYSTSNATGVEIGTLGSQLQRLRGRLGESAGSVGDLSAILVDMTSQGITGRAAMSALSGGMTNVIKSSSAVINTTQAQKQAWDQLTPSLQDLVHKYQAGKVSTADLNKALNEMPPAQAATVRGFLKAADTAEQAKGKFKNLGITVFDEKGKFVGMGSIIEQLAPKFAHMTQAQKLATAETIFGASAAKQMVSIIDAGPAAFDKATGAVKRHGAAAGAAKTQSQTFHGQLKTLESTAGDLATQFGQVLVPILTTVLGAFADATRYVVGHKAALIALGIIAGGLAAKFVFTAIFGALSSLGAAIAGVIGVMKTLAVTAIAGWEALGAVGKFAAVAGALGLIVTAIALFSTHQKSAAEATRDLSDALDRQHDALSRVRDLDLDSASAKLQARQSALNVIQAEKELNDVLKHHKSTSLEARQATLNLSQARVQAKRDTRALNDVEGKANETRHAAKKAVNDVTQATLEHTAATKGFSAAADSVPGLLQRNKEKLDSLTGSAHRSTGATVGVKTALGELPPLTKVTVHADTAQALANVQALNREINKGISLGYQLAQQAQNPPKPPPKPPHHEGLGGGRDDLPRHGINLTNLSIGQANPWSNVTSHFDLVHKRLGAPGIHHGPQLVPHETPDMKARELNIRLGAALDKWIANARAEMGNATKAQIAALNREIIERRAALAITQGRNLSRALKQDATLREQVTTQARQQRSAQSLLNSLLTAIHSHSLKAIQNALWQAHLHGMKDIEAQLLKSHSTALQNLGYELTKIHAAAVKEQTKQQGKANDAAYAKYLEKVAAKMEKDDQAAGAKTDAATRKTSDASAASVQAIQDATKVKLDGMAEDAKKSSVEALKQQLQAAQTAGKDTKVLQAQLDAATADALTATDQTALDTLSQTWDATIAAAQQGVDDVTLGTSVEQANANKVLEEARNSAALALAQQQATLDIDQALATAADAAANAAQQAASDAASNDTSTPDAGAVSTPTVPAAQFNFTINGHGMTAADLFAEVGWALKTGALPLGTPVETAPV